MSANHSTLNSRNKVKKKKKKKKKRLKRPGKKTKVMSQTEGQTSRIGNIQIWNDKKRGERTAQLILTKERQGTEKEREREREREKKKREREREEKTIFMVCPSKEQFISVKAPNVRPKNTKFHQADHVRPQPVIMQNWEVESCHFRNMKWWTLSWSYTRERLT